MLKSTSDNFRFHFKLVDPAHRSLIHRWLKEPHIAKWFYGQGLENTIKYLDDFLEGTADCQFWLAYDQAHPFAFLITSFVRKPEDELTKWCSVEGEAITLDMAIGDTSYMGKGLSPILIQEFLHSQFPHVAEVLIDPEASNARAIHVYQKAGFTILGEYIPSYSPRPHCMMRLCMETLIKLEHYDSIPKEYEAILYQGISDEAFHAKGLPPIRPFSIFIRDQKQTILGGVSGTLFYGSLYVDSLWVDKTLRHQGWGTKLMQEAEKLGKQRGARFVTLNTMDWEALPFYQKLGYSIEFTREGYEKDSMMYMLRKRL